ncbi:MAG: ATP-binding protein [Bacteroidaceae bacterium]
MKRNFLFKKAKRLGLLIGILLLSLSVWSHNVNESKGIILIISSYNPDTQRMASFINSIEDEVKKNKTSYQVLIEDMGFRGLSEVNTWVPLMQRTIDKYRQNKVSAIILLGQEAWASYLGITRPMHGVPLFTCFASQNGIDLSGGNIKNIASWMPKSINMEQKAKNIGSCGGTLNVYDIEKNVQMITSLYQSISTIAFLSDNSYGGVSLQAHFLSVMKTKFPKMKTILLDGRKNSSEKIKERISKLPHNAALLIGTWRIDNNGRYFLQSTLNEIQSPNKKIPTFTITGVGFGSAAIGGYMPEYRVNAEMIVDEIHHYATSKKAVTTFSYTDNTCRFDAKKMEEYGLQAYQIPKNAIIVDDVNKRLTEYRNYVITAISISGVLAVFLIISIVLIFNNRRLSRRLKENEKNLIAAKERAESSERLKTAFLANMSHEIRTPLNAIVGFANLIRDAENPEELEDFIHVININTELLLKLVTDVLDLSRLEAGYIDFSCTEVELNQIMTDVVGSTQLRVKENVHVVFKPLYERCVINIDKNRLLQIITNFLGNAVKFTTQGFICPGYEVTDAGIRFFVTDTGKGIPLSKKGRVFERFSKFDSFVQGTGLGLSICKTLVEAMHGTIGVDSEEGVGSTFWCVLPFQPLELKEKGQR